MEEVENFLSLLKGWIWGPPLLILLIGTGIYLTFILKAVQFRYLGYALKQVFAKQKTNAEGDISQFEALMTSVGGAIGTGTIVGVATSIAVGGLGSLFWMWVTAFVGMATKYAENLLAVKYRSMDEKGEMIGGPMQYIEKGLGWKWMAILFALFGAIGALSTGNLVQVNAITEAVRAIVDVNPLYTGVFLAVVTGLVIVGGVRSIGHVAGVLVPVMAIFYIGAGLVIILMHIDRVPDAFFLIFRSAFQGQAALGGFTGATVMMAVQTGIARSIFSNEAGLGISTMAAAAAKTDCPGRQAMINMTGALISTIIVCSISGLALAVTEMLGRSDGAGVHINGAAMAIAAFEQSIPGGLYIVSFGLILFAFTTITAWAYYGEKCFEYLFGIRSVVCYRIVFTLIVVPGAILKMDTVWQLADIMNGLMAIPNLIAVIGLSGVIVAETDGFLKIVEQERSVEGVNG